MNRTRKAWVAPFLSCLFLAGLFGLATSCSRLAPARDVEIAAQFRTIDSLRTRGRYEAALGLARGLETRTAAAGIRPWQADDAHRLVGTLARIAALPPAAQCDMAFADSLTPVVLTLLDEGDDFITATDDASRQLELRSRYLGPDHPDVAASLDLLGQVSRRAREYGSAGEYLERALALRRATLGPRHPKVGETIEHRAVLYKELHRHADAERGYREAIRILEDALPADDPALADALQALGSFCRMGERFAEAEPLYRQALEITRRNSGARSLATADRWLWLGHCQLCAGKLDAAESSLMAAREILLAHKMDRSHAMGDVAIFLARERWLRDDDAGAVRWWREFFQCRTNTRAGHAQGYGLANLLGLAGEWVDALLCEGREDEAWGEVCRGSGQVAQSLRDLSAARRKAGSEAGALDSLRAEVLLLRGRLATGDDSTGSSETGAWATRRASMRAGAADSLRVRLARTDAGRMQLERRIMTRYAPAGDDLLSVERVQSHLRPDQAMIGWIVGNWGYRGLAQKRTIWAFVLRHEGPVRWVHLGAWRNAEAEYHAWAASLDRFDRTIQRSSQWPHRISPDPELEPLARDAWDKLAAPLMPWLGGASELILVQGQARPLWPVNIYPECFRDEQGVLMGQRYAISYTPSPGLFVQLAESGEERDPARPRRVVAVADPQGGAEAPMLASLDGGWGSLLRDAAAESGPTIVDPALSRGALAGDREAIRRLPALPSSRTEVLKLATVFPAARVLIGPDAIAPALESILEPPSRIDILHLATHTLMDDQEPGRSALVMSDDETAPSEAGPSAGPAERDLITAEDVLMTWKLDTDLVTLSGCQTGRGTWTRGGEDMGFEQAFLAAGARCLLMSRWKVDDRATALLMGRFYENLAGRHEAPASTRDGTPPSAARALHDAQEWLRTVRDAKGETPFAHPVYWAGFVLVGDADRDLGGAGAASR